jgi:hypothetical protein
MVAEESAALGLAGTTASDADNFLNARCGAKSCSIRLSTVAADMQHRATSRGWLTARQKR